MNPVVYTEPVSRRSKEPPTPIARWIRDARERAGLAQDEFGNRLRGRDGKPVHRQTVTSWEGGDYAPKRDMVEQIMQKFPGTPRPPSAMPHDGEHFQVLKPEPVQLTRQANVGSLMAALEAWAASLKIPNPIDDSEFAHALTAAWLDYEKRSKGSTGRR